MTYLEDLKTKYSSYCNINDRHALGIREPIHLHVRTAVWRRRVTASILGAFGKNAENV
jgi:hypothetical protein